MTFDYQQALDYIYGFTNYEVKPQYRYSPDIIDPTRPARLLELLGNPHRDYPTVHVAGTKGKGSVAAICASAFHAAGLRVGLYTSPHLQCFTERIQLDGANIPQKELAALVEEVRPVIAHVEGITTFEVVTALAFLYFSRSLVDVGVIEVGLGGRLDATNVLLPLVSVITSLSYDHTYLLGDTLAEIAVEKGGIIKPGVPVVSADQPEEARVVLERLAAERNSPLTLIGRDYWYRQVGQDLVHQTFRAGRTGEPGSLYLLPLVGLHQAHNATVALAALELVRQGGRLPALTDEAIRQGMAGVRWQARFQLLNRRPVVIVDGAHNVAAVARLRETLESLFSGRRIILIFGVTADKDVPHMLETLAPVATEIIVTEANHPRAALPSDLTQMLAAMGRFAHSAPTVLQALEQSWAMSGPDDVICITGSLFVAGDALFAWEQFAEPTGALRAAPVEELTEVR